MSVAESARPARPSPSAVKAATDPAQPAARPSPGPTPRAARPSTLARAAARSHGSTRKRCAPRRPMRASGAICASTAARRHDADRDGRAAAAGGRAPVRHDRRLIAGRRAARPARAGAADVEHGFLLLEDLGRTLYLDALARGRAPRRPTPDARRDPRAGAVATARAARRAAAVRRGAAAARAGAVPRLVCASASSASPGTPREQQTWQRVCDALVARALAQPRVAVHRDWMPRNLMVADAQPRRSSTSRTRRWARSPTTWRRCCATPSSPGTKSARSTGPCATGRQRGAPALPVADDFGEFWRELEWMRPAAPPESAGHLLPPEAPRRQAAVFERPAALLRLRDPGGTRYRVLQPLLALIEPMSGMKAETAFSCDERRERAAHNRLRCIRQRCARRPR